MTKIHEIAGRLRAKHVLFGFDSCYTGVGLKRGSATPTSAIGLIRKLANEHVVEVITAGGKDEQAAETGGHALFTKYLLSVLAGAADLDHDRWFTGSELGVYVRKQVSEASQNRQTPQWGTISGDGHFVFEVRERG